MEIRVHQKGPIIASYAKFFHAFFDFCGQKSPRNPVTATGYTNYQGTRWGASYLEDVPTAGSPSPPEISDVQTGPVPGSTWFPVILGMFIFHRFYDGRYGRCHTV